MRKIATAAAATAIAGSTMIIGAAVAEAAPPQCPPGFTLTDARKRGEASDRNLNREVCVRNINGVGNVEEEPGFVAVDDIIAPG